VLFYKRIHETNYSNDPAYQRAHETINCTMATAELAKRYGFSWYEWLQCWFSFVNHFKLQKLAKRLVYKAKRAVALFIGRQQPR
jgi:hypothetical protein